MTTMTPTPQAAHGASPVEPGTTTIPVQGPPVDPERRKLSGVRRSDWLAVLGAAASAMSTTGLLFWVLTPLSSAFGFAAVAFVLFLGFYALLVSLDEPATIVKDRLAAAIAWSIAGLLVGVLVLIVGFTVEGSLDALGHRNFFLEDLNTTAALDPLNKGGIAHAAIGTLMQMGVALVITVPLGITCAIFLNEFPGRLARFVRTIVEAMTALPSVVAGLFIYATFILALGNEKCGLAASLAISVMMLPIIIRAADVVIRLVPANLREASYALGTSRWRTVFHVVLPTARSGLTTAVILGTARGIGETSPVLLTAGLSPRINTNLLEGPQVSLPLAVYDLVKQPYETQIQRGFGAAVTLLALVLLLFLLARLVGGRAPGQETARTRRKRRIASKRDARRFAARGTAAGLVVALAAGLVGVAGGPAARPAYADSYAPINGAGSSWSQNAVDQWRRNVAQYGMKVTYEGSGSSIGRQQFAQGSVHFAVSEIPYGIKDGGNYDQPPQRKHAYMPIVAGGTALMYNLKVGGKRVTNLRLSGEVIAKIFTGKITMWNDPAIKKDNPAISLPAREVVPVVRSDGSGSTAQFTTWMSKRQSATWNSYCAAAGRSTPCGVTSNYPVIPGSKTVAQNGSLGVAGFVKQEQNEGTITYVEYSYALNAGFPAVKVLNQAGYYVGPTAYNVAIALQKAKIDPDDLTQILDEVYTHGDPRSYPLSSYSYMILPTAVENGFSEEHGRTLAAFADYFLCEGQQQAPRLGYSPLPKELVIAGMAQIKRIPGAVVKNQNLDKCNNPTFAGGRNVLVANAPQPAACDRQGATQCVEGVVNHEVPGTGGGNNPGGGDADPDAGGGTPTGAPAPGAAPDAGAAAAIDPATGQLISAAAPGGADAAAATDVASGTVNLAASHVNRMQTLLMVLAGLVLLLVILVPPLVGHAIRPRGGRR
ncbi:phosphate ABC transporter permease PstA [Nocardioides cavernaquae]|uniref:phosphate ABC transporter permease PstA n=1 Tax=Nocardioides cavernaquae TaxID=2321396 RepID=UPI001C7E0DDE|nr:phosphate ABC transporter permease PstA [Nocardioides cavernaquae]